MKLSRLSLHKINIFVLIFMLALPVISYAGNRGSSSDPEVLLSSGTPVILETDYSFDTGLVKEGDTIYLRVQRPVYAQKVKVIRVGVIAKARIVAYKPTSGWGGKAECTLGVRSVQAVDGSEVRLDGRVTRTGEDSHGAATAVAVGAGILCLPAALAGGAVKGEEANFPVGYEVVAHVSGDHYIKVLPEQETRDIIQEQNVDSRLKMKQQRERMKELREKRREAEAKAPE